MNWLKKLQYDLDVSKADKVPLGWETSSQLADKHGFSISQTLKVLALGVKDGQVERKDFKVVSSSGLKKVPHYRRKKS